MPLKPVFPRAPFTRAAFAYLPYTAVTCQGAVAQRLENLLPSLAAMPLNGPVLAALLPAAYLTGKGEIAANCEKELEKAAAAQGTDGCLAGESWNEKVSLCHAFMAWYEAKRPPCVLPALMKFCQYLWENWENLAANSPMMAASGELMQVLCWLYHVTGKKPLLKLIDRLRLEVLDWTSHFHTFSVVKPMNRMLPIGALEADMALENGDIGGFYTRQYYMTHGEYLARSLKTPALFAQISGSLKEKSAPKVGYQKVMRYHGAANGMFNASPLLSGGDPAQSCCIANGGEWAASLGEVYHLQGEGEMADALEQVAYNCLMAAENNGLVQPRQAVNTITSETCPYVQPKEAPNALLGLVKGLCTLVRQQYMALENEGIAVSTYESSTLHWRIKGVNVKLTLESAYPAEGKMTLTVDCKTPVEFEMKMRIPGWCEDACITVNDEGGEAPKAGELFAINRTWQKGDVVTIDLPMPVRSQTWYHQTVAAFKGPRLMAIDSLQGPWRYGLDVNEKIIGYEAPGWEEVKGQPKMPQTAPKAEGEGVVLTMAPYGETKVHMAQFPQVVK